MSSHRYFTKSRISRVFILFLISFFSVVFCLTHADSAEKRPIKIGFITPLTGGQAGMGIDMAAGFKMYLEEINYTVAGRKIELIVEDEGDSPANSVNKARKLIDHDKVDLVAGLFLTMDAYAVAPVCTAAKMPLVITLSAANDLTQRKYSEYVKRLTFTANQIGAPAGDYAYKTLGWRNVAALAWDYGWGYEVTGSFQQVFEALGGKIVQKIWPPISTMDYGAYVASLDRNADGILMVVTGAPAVRLVKNLESSGLLEKMGIMAPCTSTDENIFPALGDSGIGIYSVSPNSAVLKTPGNIELNEKTMKKLGKPVTLGIELNYTGALFIVSALKKINGEVEDKNKLLEALHSIQLSDSARGPLRMDKYGQLVMNMYIRKIEKLKGNYQNTVIATYPGVSQFWTWEPETYLKTPSYSRDYPLCKYCK
jgi:branched-chain amino acid transport system substrate-binding protein